MTQETLRWSMERTLKSPTAEGAVCVIGTVNDLHLSINLRDGDKTPFQFPLDDPSLNRIKRHATYAGTGSKVAAVDLTKRSCLALHSSQIVLNGFDGIPRSNLFVRIRRALGVPCDFDYRFCSLLVYEKGSFFCQHRDHLHTPKAFGVMVIQMLSVFSGADLHVWSPSQSPDGHPRYTMDAKGNDPKSGLLRYAAFYNDCPHQVTELLEGHRAVLTFILTRKCGEEKIPIQRADHSVVASLAGKLQQLMGLLSSSKNTTKIVIGLEHLYSLSQQDQKESRLLREATAPSPDL